MYEIIAKTTRFITDRYVLSIVCVIFIINERNIIEKHKINSRSCVHLVGHYLYKYVRIIIRVSNIGELMETIKSNKLSEINNVTRGQN